MSVGYDVIVLGAGPAGEVCAGELADGGRRVAIVERELVAGECSYWACIPSKTLLRPGEALAGARHAPGAREAVGGALDAESMFKWRDFMVSDYDDAGQVQWLDEKGIDLYRGSGRLSGPGKVRVDASELTAPHIVLATGSDPFMPAIEGLAELEGVWTNREATGLREVPGRLLVLGGGPVGVEMAQAIVRMGASVTLIEGHAHVLPREPPAVGRALGAALAADGVALVHGRHVRRARHGGGQYTLTLDDGSELSGDRILVATGRRPRVMDIGLESLGIEADPHGVSVDARMNVAQGLWAIGDATGVWPLTYVGKYQARVAAANILGRPREANYDAVPRVVFTDPQAASVGHGDGPMTCTVSLADVAKASTHSREYADAPGFLTLVSDGERLIGAHAVGPEAGEWLQQATLAIRARVSLALLRDTIQPFPTFSEVYVAALAGLGGTDATAD